MQLEHALDFFLYTDEDAIAAAVEEVLGLEEGDAVVEVMRGYAYGTGHMIGGDLYLASAERKLSIPEMLAVANLMGAWRWDGPSEHDKADKAALWL